MTKNSLKNGPDEFGYYGEFGSRYAPEILMPSLIELEKANIKSAPMHPLYEWLSNETKNGWNSSLPSWNFCKYLVDEKGSLIRFFRSGVSPMSSDILSAL